MLKLLQLTDWPMPLLKPYGAFHLGVMSVGITLAVVCAMRARSLSERSRDSLLFGVGVFLMLSELYKQLFLTFVVYSGHYSWWHFPFQLCSMPMYLCLLLRWVGGRTHDVILEFLATYTLIGALGAFIEPDGMFYRTLSLTLHSFLWHILLVFIGFLVGLSALPGRKLRQFAAAVPVYLGLAGLALLLNFVLHDAARGDINMFYIGPNASGQIFFSYVYDHLGWQLNAIVYCTVTTLAALLAHVMFSRMPKKRGAGGQNGQISF